MKIADFNLAQSAHAAEQQARDQMQTSSFAEIGPQIQVADGGGVDLVYIFAQPLDSAGFEVA